jgi:hypothetical protein
VTRMFVQQVNIQVNTAGGYYYICQGLRRRSVALFCYGVS